jgi:CubicO group peptidase (beta-lactamase class C family)
MPARASAVNVSNKWAAGGFVSTPTDMVRLGNAVLAGRVVSPKTFELLTTPQTLKDGSSTGAGYAMGWRSGPQKLPASGRALRGIHHGGVATGAMSFFILFPEVGLVVALQGNLQFEPFDDFYREALAIAELFLVEESPARPGAAG